MGCITSRAAVVLDDGVQGQQKSSATGCEHQQLDSTTQITKSPRNAEVSYKCTRNDCGIPPEGAAAVARLPHPPIKGDATADAVSVVQRARLVLQKLTDITADGSRASLGRAAQLLLSHLGDGDVDAVVLAACTGGGSPVSIIGGAAGLGASLLSEQLVNTDAAGGVALCCNDLSTNCLYRTGNTAAMPSVRAPCCAPAACACLPPHQPAGTDLRLNLPDGLARIHLCLCRRTGLCCAE